MLQRCVALKIVVAMSSKILRKHFKSNFSLFLQQSTREKLKTLLMQNFWQNFEVQMRCIMENALMSSPRVKKPAGVVPASVKRWAFRQF